MKTHLDKVLFGVVLAIAGTQIVLSQRTALSPWKGGGFGMYSAPHPSQHRGVFLVNEQGEFARLVPAEPTDPTDPERTVDRRQLEFEARLLMFDPTPSKLRRLARHAADPGQCLDVVVSQVRYVPREGLLKNEVIARGRGCSD